MSKYQVRHSWEYQVTHSLPCEDCKVLKPEGEVKPKSSYIYGEGWLKRSQSCQECFDKAKKALEAKVKQTSIWGDLNG